MFVSAFVCCQPVPFVNILDLASTTSIYIFICLSVHLGLFYLSFLLLQIHPLPLPEEAPDGVENLEPIPIILIIVLLLLIVLLILLISNNLMLLRRHVFLFLIYIHKNHVHMSVLVPIYFIPSPKFRRRISFFRVTFPSCPSFDVI